MALKGTCFYHLNEEPCIDCLTVKVSRLEHVAIQANWELQFARKQVTDAVKEQFRQYALAEDERGLESIQLYGDC